MSRSAVAGSPKPPLVESRPIVIVGAGPVGLTLALDLAKRDVPVVVIDDSDRIGEGSRAVCWAKRTLEVLDRVGVGELPGLRRFTESVTDVFVAPFGWRPIEYALHLRGIVVVEHGEDFIEFGEGR